MDRHIPEPHPLNRVLRSHVEDGGTTPVELHGFWRSSATYRVRVALHLKGVAFREIEVDMDAGAQRGGDYLAINPMGGLPTLRIGDMPPMTQSLAIMELVEELWPQTPLLPSKVADRAWVRSLAAMLACDAHPLITPRVRRQLQTTHAVDDDAWKSWQRHWLSTALDAFEHRLSADGRSGDFCLGDAPGMADICLASIDAVMRVLGIEPPELPTVQRILDHCRTHACFARADPFMLRALRSVGSPS